jgi:hypothetical protein
MGLSERTLRTSTSPVVVSPGRTGALKLQLTCRNTVPGPGRSSATTALRIALVIPPLNHDAAELGHLSNLFIIVQWISVAADFSEKLDVSARDRPRSSRCLTDRRHPVWPYFAHRHCRFLVRFRIAQAET